MLSWISQRTLDGHIDTLLARASDAKSKAPERVRGNVRDPFSSLVAASTFEVQDANELVELQSLESALRGGSNAIGEFHQSVLGSVPNWENHDAGYDLVCESRRMLAEVKNKHNTMNSTNRREVIEGLRTGIQQRRGTWKGYLVIVIPRKPERYEITLNSRLYEVDGATFYELVTGEANAIHDLFEYLLDRICDHEDVAAHCRGVLSRSLPPRLPLDVEVHI